MNAKSASGIILVALMVACSTVPRDNFRRIEITAYDPEAIVEATASKGKAAATGAAVGATGGLLYSALLSLMCGPFYAACFAGSAPVFVGAYAVGGGVAGAVSASREDLSELKEFMTPLPGTGVLNQELASAVSELLPPSRLAEAGTGDARLSLGIDKLDVNKSLRRLHLQVHARASFDWQLDQGKPKHATKSYLCTTSEEVPGNWPQNSEDLVRSELDYCISDLAQQIHRALTNMPEQDPAGFSEWPD